MAQNVARCIKEDFPGAIIVGVDARSRHAGSFFVDRFIEIESAESDNYLRVIQSILARNKIDFFIPLNESELRILLSVNKNKLEEVLGNSKVIWSGRKSLELFLDKTSTTEYLKKIGVRVPKTFSLQDTNTLEYPLIIKPSKSSGSKGVMVVTNQKELNAALVFVPNPVIQEYIPSPDSEYTAAVFSRKGQESRVLVFKRILSSSGDTSWCESIYDEEIAKICETIANEIKLDGSINIQLRKFENRSYVFEVNPRFSSTVYIRSQLGFKDVLWSIDDTVDYLSFDSFSSRNQIYAVYQFSRKIE